MSSLVVLLRRSFGFYCFIVVNWESDVWNEDLKPLPQLQDIVSSLLLYFPSKKLEWDQHAVAAMLNLRKCQVPDAEDPRLNIRALHFAWIVEVTRVWKCTSTFLRIFFFTRVWIFLRIRVLFGFGLQ